MIIHVGTSGWSYDHWKGCFYPEDLAKNRWFHFYAEHFNTVEINATFYRRFKDKTYHKWREQAPDGFRYVLKVLRENMAIYDCMAIGNGMLIIIRPLSCTQ